MELILRGPTAINISGTGTGTGAGTDYVLEANTASWASGDYWYSLRMTSASGTVEVDSGSIEFLADLAGVSGEFDGRSDNQKCLDSIDAVLANRATLDQERYKINNRELWRTPISELLKLRAFYAVQVRRECARKSGRSAFGRRINVRFT